MSIEGKKQILFTKKSKFMISYHKDLKQGTGNRVQGAVEKIHEAGLRFFYTFIIDKNLLFDGVSIEIDKNID